MEPLQGERTYLENPLCEKEEKWPTQWQQGHIFYSQAQQLPYAVMQRLTLTYLPLSHPFISTAHCAVPTQAKWVKENSL